MEAELGGPNEDLKKIGNHRRLPIQWCREAELNHRHGDFQSPALPTELSRHRLCYRIYNIRVIVCQGKTATLIHHQGIICGVAFDRSSLRRIAPYA